MVLHVETLGLFNFRFCKSMVTEGFVGLNPDKIRTLILNLVVTVPC